jgi:hypothetical protein
MSSRAVAARFVCVAPKLIRLMLLVGFVVLLLVPATESGAAAQEDEADPTLLLIMDSSGSMNAGDGSGGTKIQAAKEALNGVVNALPADSLVGLRVYGHRIPNTDERRGCRDTELIVPVGPLDRSGMKRQIRSFDAKGFTPIGLSLQKGARDLPREGKRTIVLVSDGIDTCAPPPPCEVAKRLSRQGVELRIDTVGFQVDPRARRELQCIARVAKGSYFDAGSSAELTDQLARLSLRALRKFEVSGTAVSGGSSTADATPLESGRFTDTISPGEELFYAVELAEGQALKVAAKLLGQSNVGFDSFGIGQLQVYNSLRDRWPTNALEGFDGASDSTKWSLKTPEVGSGVGPDAEFFGQPGTYYFSLRFTRNVGTERQSPIFKREFKSRLRVKVVGQPVAPSPTPTESVEPTPEGTAGSGAAAPPSDTTGSESDPPYVWVYLMTFLIGLLVGFAIVAIKGFTGRRPPPATERSA